MVGQGVLRECLQDPSVERVLAIGRSAATLMPVLQFCTLALPRVDATLIAATMASRKIAHSFWPVASSGTNSWRYDVDATASVAAEPLPMTRKKVHP